MLRFDVGLGCEASQKLRIVVLAVVIADVVAAIVVAASVVVAPAVTNSG